MAGGILEKHAHILSKIRITDGMIYPLGNNDIPNTKTKLLPTIKYYKNHLYILGGLNV